MVTSQDRTRRLQQGPPRGYLQRLQFRSIRSKFSSTETSLHALLLYHLKLTTDFELLEDAV